MSELAAQVRSERRRWAAPGSSHDRIIRIARIVLPIGIAVLLTLLAIAPMTIGRDISFVLAKDHVAVAQERMRVTDARYRGQDSAGKPFAITARSAVQKSSADPIVRLSALAARLDTNNGPAAIAANAGRYDMTRERIMIDGPIVFKTADGYRMQTRDVAVDLKTRLMASGGPVDGTMPLGTFRADLLRADLTQHNVVLEGGARLHIVQGQSREAR